MTQEQKELLLKDLCARSFYGVMCDRLGQAKKLLSVSPDKLYCIELDNGEYTPSKYKVEDVKPYLRPMSSMTDKEKDEYDRLVMCNASWVVDDWLNSHYLDYRGLIPKGLALPATKGMYNLNNIILENLI